MAVKAIAFNFISFFFSILIKPSCDLMSPVQQHLHTSCIFTHLFRNHSLRARDHFYCQLEEESCINIYKLYLLSYLFSCRFTNTSCSHHKVTYLPTLPPVYHHHIQPSTPTLHPVKLSHHSVSALSFMLTCWKKLLSIMPNVKLSLSGN